MCIRDRYLLNDEVELGLATVYRVLTQFESAGIVIRHNFEEGHSVFELANEDHHDHIVCVRCGKVEEFNKQIEEPVIVSCRLKGIDTPEMKPPKNIENRNDILIKAHAAREITANYFQNKNEIFGIHVEGLDKYGRWLITEKQLNDTLIQDSLAVEYKGGTK